MNCPSCQIKVPRDAINIQKDIAQCQNCGNIFSISAHVSPQKNDLSSSKSSSKNYDYDIARQSMYKEADLHNQSIQKTFDGKNTNSFDFDINNPPKGAYINHLPNGVQIGASTRSWFAFFIVPFMIVWSGGSLGGIYGSQIISGEFDPFMSLFGIPFVLGSLLFWGIAIMTVMGKIEVTLDSKGGHIFTGVGKIGQYKRFLWSEINSVSEKTSVSHSRKGGSTTTHSIVLEGQKQIKFGSHLSSERRYYMIKTLEQLIQNKSDLPKQQS
ncbi:hypothetical protein ACE193_00595 [Bernardetia sp. OM2101]|uniref:hypothetical protein n=1 Tax=Bernardetia sp. OM2101 TaxID=3344876 RepID=UPI0035CF24BD